MSFLKYSREEARVLRKRKLVEKFFEGKTLAQRTSLERRDLSEICQGSFTTSLLFNDYCNLALDPSADVSCPYLSKTYDQNGLRKCQFYETFLDETCFRGYSEQKH